MNWTYILGGIAAEIGLLTLVYNLTASRFKTHNKWLREQLDLAKENSSDNLVKIFSDRAKMLEEEATRLRLDRENNQAEIKKKEAERDHNRKVALQIKEVMEEVKRRYDELKKKVDVCPYCEAGLVELKDIHDEDWTGSHRKYECGYTILDGDRIFFCPSDPEYPNFDDEFEIEYQGRIIGGGWTAYSFPKTAKARMVEQIAAFGKTQESALQNLKEEYYRNPSKTETDVPAF
jgi:rubrerythrin